MTAPEDHDSRDGLTPEQRCALLSDRRRRVLLEQLANEMEGTVEVEALVEAVVEAERSNDTLPDADSVAIGLRHAHLPKLDELGVVSFDPRRRTVQYHGDPGLERQLEALPPLDD